MRFSDSGWFNAGLTIRCLEALSKHCKREQICLVLDNVSVHTPQEVLDYAAANDIHLIFVPAGCTAKLQPLDVCVNGPVKCIARQLTVQRLRTKPRDTIRLENAIEDFETAYERIKATTIRNGFYRALGPAFAQQWPRPQEFALQGHLKRLQNSIDRIRAGLPDE